MTYRLYFVLSRWLFKEHNKDTLRKYLPYGETNINSFMTEAPIISKALVSRVNLWTGFYIIGNSVMKELKKKRIQNSATFCR